MKKLFIFLCISGTTFGLYAQSHVLIVSQGHGPDDIYVDAYRNLTPNRAIYHITGYGSQLSEQYDYQELPAFNYFIADPTPGVLLGNLAIDTGYKISYDYGKSWTTLNTLSDQEDYICGGGIAGECYFGLFRGENNNPYHKLMYSTDFGNSIHTVFDSCFYYIFEAGQQAGELYSINICQWNGLFMLLRSTDYGQHFDTTFLDGTVINYSNITYISGLFRGAHPGELFLVPSRLDTGTWMEYDYIQHSTDYGHSWNLENVMAYSISDGGRYFTSGRDSCSFYYVQAFDGSETSPSRIIVHCSSDCGQTFISYEYQLAVPTGIPEKENRKATISLFPNPAISQTRISGNHPENFHSSLIRFISSTGQMVREIPWDGGTRSLDLSGMNKGLYLIQVQSKGINKYSKLVIE